MFTPTQSQSTKTGKPVDFSNAQFSTQITRHRKKQENLTRSKGENKWAENTHEEVQILPLLGKDFKTVLH